MTDKLLWTSVDAPHVTILGSVHYLSEGLPEWVTDAKDSAEAIVFEADFAQLQPPLPVDQENRLSVTHPEIWKEVAALSVSLTLSEDDIGQQTPFFIIQRLLGPLLSREGINFSSGIDINLFDQSKADEKPVLALESCSEFYALLAAPEVLADSAALLEDFVCDPLATVRRTVALVNAWRACDLAIIERITEEMREKAPRLYVTLFPVRHHLWLPRLRFFIERARSLNHRLLIVVGTGHLVGPDSLLIALKANGYSFDLLREER